MKNLKKKLDELLPMLASPLPSPDINAPSPSPDSDIELPGDSDGLNQSSLINLQDTINIPPPSMYGTYGQDYNPVTAPLNNTTADFTNNFSSFIGGNLDFDPVSLINFYHLNFMIKLITFPYFHCRGVYSMKVL